MELAAAVATILAPIQYVTNIVFVQPTLTVLYFVIDFWSRYLLDYPLGHIWVRTVMSPLMTYTLNRVFDARGLFRLFGHMPNATRRIIAGFSTLFSPPLISEPIKQAVSNLSIVYCDVMHGPQLRSAATLFFYFCTWQGGRFVGQDMATGDTNNPENIYYPKSLKEGVLPLDQSKLLYLDGIKDVLTVGKETRNFVLNKRMAAPAPISSSSVGSVIHELERKGIIDQKSFQKLLQDSKCLVDAEWSKEKNNIEIAMSCLLFSLMTYQTNEQLEEAQKQGMISDMQIFFVDTYSSGTQMVAFVNHKHKFAVFGYRGTQFQIMRQFLTSLDFRLEYFQSLSPFPGPESGEDGVARIRTVYYDEVKKSYEMLKFKTKLHGQEVNARQLLEHLKLALGYKIYLTGHSLGGGLSTVLAAHLMTRSNNQNRLFDALVTFGATPVGDKNFVHWFNKRVPASWRFMFGDEFAPMVPPLPYFTPVDDIKLVHVGDFHHFDLPPDIVAEDSKQADELLVKISNETGMMRILTNHIPILTLRGLQEFHNESNKGRHDRIRLDVMRSSTEEEAILEDKTEMETDEDSSS